MLRWAILLGITTLCLSGCAPLSAASTVVIDTTIEVEPNSVTNESCAVTQPIQEQPPDDPHADPFPFGNWHINADRTIWVALPHDGTWGTGGEKVLWIRPAGTELVVRGERLDATAPPLLMSIPCCYPTGFQVTGMYFPTVGCWEVTATAGKHELRFITQVEDASQTQAKTLPD